MAGAKALVVGTFTGVEDTVAGGVVDTTDALAEVVLPEFRSGYQQWDLAFKCIALLLIVQQLFSLGVGGRHLLVVELLLEPEDLLVLCLILYGLREVFLVLGDLSSILGLRTFSHSPMGRVSTVPTFYRDRIASLSRRSVEGAISSSNASPKTFLPKTVVATA